MNELNFIPFPILTTERLSLRRIRPEDEKDIFALLSNERVETFLDRPIAKNIPEARQSIHKMNDQIADRQGITWAIVQNETHKLIGTIGLQKFLKIGSSAEISYALMPAYNGQGLLQEALAAVMEYGFKHIALENIAVVLHPDNVNAIHLLEKNGFVKEVNNNEANIKDKSIGTVVYTLLNHGYLTLSSS